MTAAPVDVWKSVGMGCGALYAMMRCGMTSMLGLYADNLDLKLKVSKFYYLYNTESVKKLLHLRCCSYRGAWTSGSYFHG